MRASLLRALVLGACVLGAATAAEAQQSERAAWAERADTLAQRIVNEQLIITPEVRQQRQELARHSDGEARLQILYDLAADDYIASSGDAAVESFAALASEAEAQHSARFMAMADVLRGYAPALEGDYLAVRQNLSPIVRSTEDPIVRAAAARLLAYALTDLGLFGNSLEVARTGLVHLPDTPGSRPLRSGLHDAMAYNSVRVGDYETALHHLERTLDLDLSVGRPVDGVVLVNNLATMLAMAGDTEAAQRMVRIHGVLAQRSGQMEARFFANLACARVNLLAQDYQGALQCADAGRNIEGVSAEYLPRLLVYRALALARLNRGQEARAALAELQTIATDRGDPDLSERLRVIEPEVLNAEGRYEEAFAGMRDAHQAAERNLMTRFNAGVRELRATMESEVAQAEQRAEAQSIRSELQNRTLEKMTLATLLVGCCLVAMIVISLLIYRSRRNMLAAVGRAEEILARRVVDGAPEPANDRARRVGPTQRLRTILDEIERRDVALERAFKDLDAARLAAEDASIAKSQFLATMSHELRTPLNAIIGYGEMLIESAEERNDSQDRNDLGRIHSAAKRLLSLINDVLDLSKIEAGGMEVCAEEIDLRAMMEEIVETVAPAAAANGTALSIDADAAIGVAHTDGFKLSQCLLNLMANAAKFTEDGQVKLRGRRDGDWLVFDVIDTGIGIAPDTVAKLFQPFVQADASTTRQYGGTGLGLVITRRLAHLIGGEVTVKSVLGQGSAFTLRVPANLDGAANANTDQTAAAAAA